MYFHLMIWTACLDFQDQSSENWKVWRVCLALLLIGDAASLPNLKAFAPSFAFESSSSGTLLN
jgi:hypothetical protein